MQLCQHHVELYATDTHCHLERFRRPQDVLARSVEAGVRVIAVTSRPSDFRMLFPLYGRREGVRLALGLHPLEVAKVDLESEMALFSGYAAHTSYIGEVGLDFSRDGRGSLVKQEKAFDAILAIPGVTEKILSVHSRGAAKEVITRLRQAGASRVVLHWFTGGIRDLDDALDAGFYFSINPVMTRSVKGRTIIDRLASARVLVESDGPYARIDGRELEPRDVCLAFGYLAKQWQMTSDEVSAEVAENLRHLIAAAAS